MKNILILDTDYSKDLKVKQESFSKTLKQFKLDANDLLKSNRLKIVKELPPNEILVEYDEKDLDIKKCFLSSKSVAIIDLYIEEIPKTKMSAKEELMAELMEKMKNIQIKNKK